MDRRVPSLSSVEDFPLLQLWHVSVPVLHTKSVRLTDTGKAATTEK